MDDNYGTETLPRSFKDWVGVPGSPSTSDEARMDLDDVPVNVSSFDKDIDDALGLPYDFLGPLDIFYPVDPEIDWQALFNATMPFPPPALTDDSLSTSDSFNQPLSPVSDATLVDPSLPSFLPDFKLPMTGDALVDQPVASLCSTLDDFEFTFQYQSATATPAFGYSPAMVEQVYQDKYDNSQGQYWPGQQPSQHAVGAAGAVAPGLATGVEMEVNADAFAFTAMGPTSLLPLPDSSPEPLQDDCHLNTNQAAKCVRATCKKQPRVDSDADSNYSASESCSGDDTPAPPRKRRKQDTTKRHPCHYENCDAFFSRTHNLRVHINSVHLKKRTFACKEAGCARAFSRKHDLERHHQSAHTDLGSPRNANNVKGAKGRKATKKDKHDA